MIELLAVGVGQRILILGAAQTTADADVLPRLHKKLHPFDPGDFRAEALNNLIGGLVALVMRLELDEHPAGVLAGVEAGRAGETDHPEDCRILPGDIGDLLHISRHLGKGRVLARLRRAKNEAGILLREKALRDLHIEKTGRPHQQQGQEQRRQLMAEDKPQPAVIDVEERHEDALGTTVEATRLLLAVRF